MKASLLALLVGLFHPGELTPAIETRATGAAQEIVEVVNARLPDAPPQERMEWASLLFVFARFEALFLANPRGWNDDGHACGVLQVWQPQKYVDGATCERVRADRRLGLRVGLEVMLRLTSTCGSRVAGLTAYATSGACPTKWMAPIVAKRCRAAGLTSSCEALRPRAKGCE